MRFHALRSAISLDTRTAHRPIDNKEIALPNPFGDPEGGAQEVRRFSTQQDAASKNPGQLPDGRFASVLRVFFGDFLDSRLWCSPPY